jgi:E3 ubiquitin-protein ligase DOA10
MINEDLYDLITHCLCSIKYVYNKCIGRWLSNKYTTPEEIVNNAIYEICNYKYRFKIHTAGNSL